MDHSPLSDRQLVRAVLDEVPGAFERLVREHQPLCWHIAYKLTRDREDARDLCQEIFLKVHRHLRQYRSESALGTWIGRIAYHCALRHMERRRLPIDCELPADDEAAGIEAMASAEDVHERASQAQIDAIVHAHIKRLPPVQGLLLTLYHLDGFGISDIAAMTGMPDNTIKSHLARGRARLRDGLAITLGVRP